MTIPNLITLSRIPILFCIVVLLFVPLRGAASFAFVLFIVAAWTDWLDGYLARVRGEISNFGKLMDALTDKILIVGMFVSLLALQVLPAWCTFAVLLVLSREFLITGLRMLAASHGQILAAEKGGKLKTVAQIAAIVLLLAAVALSSDFGLSPENLMYTVVLQSGLIIFLVATLQTVVSGVQYLIKYWNLFLDKPL